MKNILKSVIVFSAIFTLGVSGAGGAMAQEAQNLPLAEQNRNLVLSFYDDFFNQHQVDHAAKVVAGDYKQHNPYVADGKKPFVSYFKGFFKENPQSRARIIRSAVDGDLVWVQVHSTKNPADRGEAVVDIFRVQNGKIVEHWDVIQEIPEESANRNTMF